MTQNTFYGKKLNELNSDELQLLSIDMQITGLRKRGRYTLPQLAMADKFRVKAVNKCMNMGGDYSRSTFEKENDLPDDGPPKEEIKMIQKVMNEFNEMRKNTFINSMKESKEKNRINPNGRNEFGFEMN